MTASYPEITCIVGSGRCGSRYLSRMLRHSMDIGFRHEPKFIVPIYRQLHRFGDLEKAENLRGLLEAILKYVHLYVELSLQAEDVLERVAEPTYTGVVYAVFQLVAERLGNSRLGYKDPADIIHLPLLAEILPTARFVHIIRDGRDVALSLLKFPWGPTNLYCGARYWAHVVATGRRDGTHLADRYFELRFEDLILSTEHTAAELGSFVNRNHSANQIQDLVQRINWTKRRENIQVWTRELQRSQRYLCEAAAGEVLSSCGYPIEFDDKARISPLEAAYYSSADLALRIKNRLTRRYPPRVTG